MNATKILADTVAFPTTVSLQETQDAGQLRKQLKYNQERFDAYLDEITALDARRSLIEKQLFDCIQEEKNLLQRISRQNRVFDLSA